MTYNPDDLGLDLERAKALPECMACRKKSDGARMIGGVVFCGTHADEFWKQANDVGGFKIPMDFAVNLRATKYRNCWTATLDD